MWEKLQGASVDLLIIGGGITGCGIARDAVRRGLTVALVEQSDFASGTSSRSSKLVHGGLRYLEQYEFSMVFESVSERRILMDLAPHLVNPLGFLLPVYKNSRVGLWKINAGMWLYDGLSLFRSPKIHKKLRPSEVAKIEPSLRQAELVGAPLYYDCATDDARLTLETVLDAVEHGAITATYCRMQSFLKGEDGRVCGATVKNMFSDELCEVHAKAVINATGPWTDRVLAQSDAGSTAPVLRPTKGIHFVVDYEKLPLNNAILCSHPVDGRVLFVIPWSDRTYVGTTDTDYQGDPADVYASAEDVHYLLKAANHHFPEHQLGEDDIISTWAGLRPLIAPEGEASESEVSREHEIRVGRDGLITIAGGKLTTYRAMAAEVVDKSVRLLELSGSLTQELKDPRTRKEPLPGGVGWPADDDHERVAGQVLEAAQQQLSLPTCRHLANTYGMRALELAERVVEDPSQAELLVDGRPEIMGQVDFAVEKELAATLSDIMIRRTQLFYRDHDQGLGAMSKITARLAKLLDWNETRCNQELEYYQREVSRSRQWKVDAHSGN